MNTRTAVGAVALACVPLLALSSTATAAPGHRAAGDDPHVLAEGLAGPLGLSVANDGTVYVAEQFAGRLTAVHADGSTSTVLEAPVAGVDANGRGTLTVTLFAAPGPETEPVGTLTRVGTDGSLRDVGSPLQHELEGNPDAGQTYGFLDASEDCLADTDLVGFGRPYTGILDSRPYAVLVDRGHRYVADAAGNTILKVRADGQVSTVAVLPPVESDFTEELRQSLLAQVPPGQFPEDLFSDCVGSTYLAEPVPTDVERGPGGALYVSTLPGFPEAPGTAAVFRVDERDGSVEQLHDGFNGAVDLAVSRDGTVYVAELLGGQLTRISPSGERDSVPVESPGAVEVAKDGSLYVTTGVFGNGTLLHYPAWPAS